MSSEAFCHFIAEAPLLTPEVFISREPEPLKFNNLLLPAAASLRVTFGFYHQKAPTFLFYLCRQF